LHLAPGRNFEFPMPRDLIQMIAFVVGMWIAFELLLPLAGG